MHEPLVSILTANYNREAFLEATLESVLAQTYANWEMIIVDDGSTDGSWAIIERYAAQDPRIRGFRQENKGMWRIGETTNRALDLSSGRLIAILDSDDTWPAHKLEVQVPRHLREPFGLSFGQVEYIDAEDWKIGTDAYPDHGSLPFFEQADPHDLLVRNLAGEFFISPVGVLMSRDVLDEIGGLDQPSYLPVYDYSTFLRLGTARGGFTYVPEVLGYWRQHTNQSTWYLARDMAMGAYRFASEHGRAHLDAFRIAIEDLDRRLLSPRRRDYLASATYRSAAVAFEAGSYRQALRYGGEIARLGRIDWMARCLAMFGRKASRKLLARLRRPRALGERQGREGA